MDTKKNIQKNGPLSLLDMRMEQFTVSLSKKCDRLATALYLVTNFLSDTEPLKFRLRSLSLELVRGATLVRYGTIQDELTTLGTILSNISETLGLFELAFINGLVSEMNFSILKREYISLSDAIQIRKTSRTSRTDTLFEKSFFGSPLFENTSAHDNIGTSEKEAFPKPPQENSFDEKNHGYSQGQYKGHSDVKDSQTPKQMSDIPTNFLKNKITKKREYQYSPQNRDQKHTEFLNRKTQDISLVIKSRRVRIMKLVKDKKEVSVKDIADHFPELSEKTIQRELVSLTESGVFKRAGERRWSRYSLAEETK